MYDINNFGKNIRKARELIGCTQQELADIIGCHHTHISHIELGYYKGKSELAQGIGLAFAIKLINELGLTFEKAFAP